MARRRTRNSDTARESSTSANFVAVLPSVTPSNLLTLIEDRRTWHPEGGHYNALNFFNQPHELEAPAARKPTRSRPAALYNSIPHQVGFKDAPGVLLCVRRKSRREVLFAKRKTKKGAGSRRRRNWFSNIRC